MPKIEAANWEMSDRDKLGKISSTHTKEDITKILGVKPLAPSMKVGTNIAEGWECKIDGHYCRIYSYRPGTVHMYKDSKWSCWGKPEAFKSVFPDYEPLRIK